MRLEQLRKRGEVNGLGNVKRGLGEGANWSDVERKGKESIRSRPDQT
jgi:hypothetical protein